MKMQCVMDFKHKIMTREEKCKLAIERGYTYDPETGLIYSRLKKILKKHDTKGYFVIGLTYNQKSYKLLAHQFAWYYIHKECVEQLDHINGVRDDNRMCNLRSVTRQQNQWNRKTAKGYSWSKEKSKWRSQIQLNKKNIHVGYYKSEQEARNAYLAAKEIYHKI